MATFVKLIEFKHVVSSPHLPYRSERSKLTEMKLNLKLFRDIKKTQFDYGNLVNRNFLGEHEDLDLQDSPFKKSKEYKMLY